MESNTLQIETSMTADLDVIEASMQNKLVRFLCSSNFKCSIYKVPEFIRDEDKECYRPAVISIGPVFYKDPKLQAMQQLKWIYLESFLKRFETADRSLKHYINIVREIKGEIQECYEDLSMISSCCSDDEFVEMIVLDAIFLLYLVTRLADSVRTPTKLRALKHFVRRDIFVLENQIPYFVIHRIFDKAFPTGSISSITLTHGYISDCYLPGGTSDLIEAVSMESNDIRHLLDFWWKSCHLSFDKNRQAVVTGNEAGPFSHLLGLWRKSRLSSFHAQQSEQQRFQFPHTAKQLCAAGVAFKKSESKNPLSITFNGANGELHIPKFFVFDETKNVIRSMLLYEQCHYWHDHLTYFVDWVVLLNQLIDNAQDIQILQQAGIFDNQIGSDKELSDFFNKIDKNTVYDPKFFNYSNVCQEVNTYANKRWNRWKAILRRDYFNHPWAIISFIFAVILFILTVIQTVTGFKKN